MKTRAVITAIFSAASFIIGNVVFATNPDFMNLEELQSRLDRGVVYGYFESVERGISIKQYSVRIRCIYSGPDGKMIIFTTNHKVVAGMSGSPVYVDGKLIGAVGYSVGLFSFSALKWGGISPICLMEKESGGPSNKSLSETSVARPFAYKNMLFEPISTGMEAISGTALQKLAGNLPDNGLLRCLRQNRFVIASRQITKTDNGRGFPANTNPALRAGMPILVDLVEWRNEEGEEVTISALGTITYVSENGRVYAFGHPFFNAKAVNYAFRTCEVAGTVFSEYDSFKIRTKPSRVLGVIDFDSAYGIYGSVAADGYKNLDHITLEFRKREQEAIIHKFDLSLAHSKLLTPFLAELSAILIGEVVGAPSDEDPTLTQFHGEATIDGHKPVVTNRLFARRQEDSPRGFTVSSYGAAINYFFVSIYGPLFQSDYNFTISDAKISVNFIEGQGHNLKLAAYRFPRELKWGENPVLEVLFVSEDNSLVLEKSITIKIDWDLLKRDIVVDDENKGGSAGIVHGYFEMWSGDKYESVLDSKEKEERFPGWFINADDFLRVLSLKLALLTNQRVSGRLIFEKKHGPDSETNEESILLPSSSSDPENWQIVEGGLKERLKTTGDQKHLFSVDFPPIPIGYVVESFAESVSFEIKRGVTQNPVSGKKSRTSKAKNRQNSKNGQ